MNANLNPVMAQALSPFAGKPAKTAQQELNDLLRIPFYVDLSSSGRLEDEQEIRVPDEVVKEVISNFIELHMPEIEARLCMLVRVRRLRGES